MAHHNSLCMFFNQLGHSYSECSVISRTARSALWLRGYSVYSAKEKRHVKRGVSGLYLDYARAIKSGTARFSRIFTSACRCKPPSNHSHVEEFVVGFGHRQLVDEELQCVDFAHWVNDLTQNPHFLQFFLRGEQLFFTRT